MVALNNRSAMGGYLMFDKATPTLQANLHLNYAYHVPLNYNDVKLSFGLGAKLMYHNIDFNKEDLPLGEDPAFSTSAYDKTLADASSGVYFMERIFMLDFLCQICFNHHLILKFKDLHTLIQNIEIIMEWGLINFK